MEVEVEVFDVDATLDVQSQRLRMNSTQRCLITLVRLEPTAQQAPTVLLSTVQTNLLRTVKQTLEWMRFQ